MFTSQDLNYLKNKGIELKSIESQVEAFTKGFPFLDIHGPAVPGNGIIQLTLQQQYEYERRYNEWKGSRVKFVPASGAASRMFKDLFEASVLLSQSYTATLSGNAALFFQNLEKFAFYGPLSRTEGFNPGDRKKVIDLLLGPEGLRYGSLPKGLILFHNYPSGPRTAFEEHLVESAFYCTDPKGLASLHFTVSEEHVPLFSDLWNKVKSRYQSRFGITFNVSFSVQDPVTDTIAVDLQNQPFRKNDGTLLFRPGGHGALLENLNKIKDDIVFIKNIDNVVPEPLLSPVIHWKKVLAGLLLECRKKISDYLADLQNGAEPLRMKEIAAFLEEKFCITHPAVDPDNYRSYLYSKLNRPLRVCGMVPAAGEPGGGPFRVTDNDGAGSLQILESVQLQRPYPASTHFNPVDIVCSCKAYDGTSYHLPAFRDDSTGFISQKSMEGRELKALELPGLWNGGMSRWNTLFVEVPPATFNPVKTVTDLLRKEHNY